MRRRALLCGVASAALGSIAGCGEPTFDNEDPRSKDEYGTVHCGLDGERTTDPAEQSSINGLDGAWPTTYFDERLTAYNSDATPPRDCPQTQWRSQIEIVPTNPGSSRFIINGSPVIVEGACYVRDSNTELYAYDSRSGDEMWRLRTNRGGTEGITHQEDTLYVSYGQGLGAIDLEAREEQWFARISEAELQTGWSNPVSAPTVAGETVCLGTMQGILRAYNPGTGRVRWRFDIADQSGITEQSLTNENGDAEYASAHPPAIVDDLVISPFVIGDVFALDRATGAVAWRLQLPEYIHPSGGLAVHGDACFLATQTDLLRIDLADGTVEWRLTERWPGDVWTSTPDGGGGDERAELYVASSPAVTPPDGGDTRSSPTVFVDVRAPSMATQLHAVDAETGAVHWRAPVATGWGNDVCVGGDVVFVGQGEFLVALDRDTGAILYGVEQYPSRGTVALVDDAIFAGDVYGHVYAVS